MDVPTAMLAALAQCCPPGGGRISNSALLVGFVLVFSLWHAVKWTRSTWKAEGTTGAGRWARVALVLVLAGAVTALAAAQVAGLAGDTAADVVGTATTPTRGIPKLVDLGSKNCIPCKQMAPILDELQREYAGRFDVEFIDVGLRENQELAQRYGVRLIPTQIFFNKDGYEVWRHEGFLGKADILAKWRELGIAPEAVWPGGLESPGEAADGSPDGGP